MNEVKPPKITFNDLYRGVEELRNVWAHQVITAGRSSTYLTPNILVRHNQNLYSNLSKASDYVTPIHLIHELLVPTSASRCRYSSKPTTNDTPNDAILVYVEDTT